MYRREPQSLAIGRNIPAMTHHRNLAGVTKDSDENLDLFSRNRRGSSLTDSDVSVKLGRLSAGSTKLGRSGMDDLLTSTDGGKHDYDWLLTPPGTPLYPSVDRNEPQQQLVAPKRSGLTRSVSTTKGSRLSVSQPEINRPRPARSSSVTRPSVSTNQFSTYSNKSNSVLNTSSASVSSYIRPSTPNSRSSSRPSTPSSRPIISRSSTPSRSRPSPPSSSIENTRPARPVLNSRPSTPTSRAHVPTNSSIPSTRSLSRPSTPTRRSSAPPLSTAAAPPSSPATRSLSRPSSPSARVARAPPQPMTLPDFSLETPPNLRTTLPDRPLSASRSRPGVKGNEDTQPHLVRRPASPVGPRGRMVEPPLRGRSQANGQGGEMRDSRKVLNGTETLTRKPVRPSSQTVTEGNGFGRTISKKSLDMAMRHMDIKNGTTGIRPLSGTVRFPQSIRSINPKGPAIDRSSNSQVSGNGNSPNSNTGADLENGNYFSRSPETVIKEENRRLSSKLIQMDIYESSRYDAILLKEDLKNTNWLLSADDKSDQGPNFDHGFEPLPELFDP